MIVLTVQYGKRVQFGFESRTASEHSELTATPVGDIFAGDVAIEGVLLQHDLLRAILADNEEGRVTFATTAGTHATHLLAILQLQRCLADLDPELVIELDCNERYKKR